MFSSDAGAAVWLGSGGQMMRPCSSNFMPSARPIFTSISLISLSDLRPKFLVFSISFSLFWTSSRVVGSVLRRFDRFHRLFKVDEDAHVVLDELGGEADGILRGDCSVGPHFNHQLFIVGHLTETGGFDGVVHLAHWRMHAVD